MGGRILVVGVDDSILSPLSPGLEAHGWRLELAEPSTLVARASSADVVVADTTLAQSTRDALRGSGLATPVLVTGEGAVQAASELGLDYLLQIRDPVAVALRARRALHRPSELGASDPSFEELVGTSPLMRELYDLIDRAADNPASVLITGESGTGKELVARALHNRSRRRERPLVAINCSSVPSPLLESELFGHVRGAFTDAKTGRVGLFVKAHGGTLFLDEIGDLPLALQPKLLRALQERKVRAVGDDAETPIDVRVIAATHHNLEDAIAERRFREDLFYRLNVIHIPVPPLRNRATDILSLARYFANASARAMGKSERPISSGAAERLVHYGWPGNVRELQNCMERAVALCRSDELRPDDLPPKIRDYTRSHVLVVSNEPAELITLEELERRYIIEVLDRLGGSRKDAARVLGIDRKTLYRKLRRYGLGSDTPSE